MAENFQTVSPRTPVNRDTKVLSASVRSHMHVVELAKGGVHGLTMPFDVLLALAHHPATDAGLEKFLKDWNEAGL